MKKKAQHACCEGHAKTGKPAGIHGLTSRLRADARKVTGPRQAILGAMRSHPHPMTIKEIQAEMAGQCDPATIYRSMHLLVKMGLVQRFDFGDGSARFELMDESRDAHHHHLVCVDCSKIEEIHECLVQEFENAIAASLRYQDVTHKLEFFGVCPSCQESRRAENLAATE